MIIDTHCHLNDEKLRADADKIVAAFDSDGIESAICVGYDLPSSEEAVEIAEKYDRVYAAVGIHPHDATTADYDKYDRIAQLASSQKTVAIGEIGLDYHYDLSPRAIQKGVFKEQIELAQTVGLPIILHIRDAYEEARQVLFEMSNYLTNGVLLHCYSGSKEMVDIFNKVDAYYAFGGAITFKNAKHNVEALKAVPRDRLLFETDCPYMAPVPHRGEVNVPKYVNLVADKAAEILQVDRAELVAQTTNNAKALFTKIK